MTLLDTYRQHFKDPIYCENCGAQKKLHVFPINKDEPAEINNLICLCDRCLKYFERGEFSRYDLKYIHIIRLNAHERSLR